jgi:hypothetical protein
MTPLTIFVSAFLLALIVASFAFMGGAVPVAIPAAILLIAVIGWGNYARRRTIPSHSSERYENAKHQAEGADDLPAGDPSTLYTGSPKARAR